MKKQSNPKPQGSKPAPPPPPSRPFTDRNICLQYPGGYWGEGHPKFTVDDWKYEVMNGDTRAGYWTWVWKQMQEK